MVALLEKLRADAKVVGMNDEHSVVRTANLLGVISIEHLVGKMAVM